MRIAGYERAAGGFAITIEHQNAYTDGSSRFEKVTVPASAIRGKTPAQIRQAVVDALDDPLADIIGEEVDAPTPTKDILWERAEALFANWKMAKETRIEAQARTMAAAVITAFTNAENALWAQYMQTMNEWRLA